MYYLYGPGKANEHTDPHMVAAWGAGVPDPGRGDNTNIPLLAALLDAPVAALESRPPAQHVYHVPVSLDPGDRILSDEEWAEVAREVMDATGVAPKDDPMGARWVAIRHADNHIHIVATLARQDGLKVRLSQDKKKMQACARELEVRYGLRRLASGDRTAAPWPTTAEAEKAKRMGRDETPRQTLQRTVREAAAGAQSEDEFFTRLQRSGLRVSKKTADDGSMLGYSVALPGDRTGAGRAVWFSGSRLAPDLSLPRIRERWTGTPAGALLESAGPVATRAAAWQAAAEHVHQAAAILGQSGNAASAGEMVALSDLLTTYATQAPAEVRQQLRDAARTFERAGRAPTSRQMTTDAHRHLRTATQLVAMSASLGVSGGEAAAAITILVAVALAVVAAQRLHQAAQHRAQEEAAALAGRHLRAATEIAYGAGADGRRGSRAMWQRTRMDPSGPALADRFAPVVRQTLPTLAEQVLSEAAWPALAATLAQVEAAGYDPATVLGQAAGARGFGDAESAAEVLVWRLQRRMTTDAEHGRPPVTGPIKTDAPAPVPTTRTTGEGSDEGGTTTPTETTPPPVVSRADTSLGDGVPTLGEAVRQAVPEYVSEVLSDPAAAGLAAALRRAVAEGHAPADLLAEVVAARDLADADSVAQVLTWRVQGRLTPGRSRPLPRTTGRRTSSPTAPPSRAGERTAAELAQDAARKSGPPRGPRR
ncbi:relaxase/mobilization nuclease domain-containing protein [Streptomyces jumonjinensis]|uniref:Mobilization protein n=1 Tax=Streptomyces jumonjinensis TaxID=1945 RepID=A0A646KLI8_STRJU|nr:relaxase/mobilization nuclease domain-containing protein [Streptomyces jumonjinensis]MQT02918.1 mobilization protein [Streptomyces jumonjinensis]